VKLRQGAATKVARKDVPTTLLAGATIKPSNGLGSAQITPVLVTDPNDARVLTRSQYNSMLDTKGPAPGGMARTMQVISSEPKLRSLQDDAKRSQSVTITANATLPIPSSGAVSSTSAIAAAAAADRSLNAATNDATMDHDVVLSSVGSNVVAPESFTSNFFARKMATKQAAAIGGGTVASKKAATFSPSKARREAESEARRINMESERLNQAILAGHDPTWGLPLGDGTMARREGPQGVALPSRGNGPSQQISTFEKSRVVRAPRERFARTDARVTGGVILPAAAGAQPRHLPAPPIGSTTGHGLFGNTTPRGASSALDEVHERNIPHSVHTP
jgi:hypothetical protein